VAAPTAAPALRRERALHRRRVDSGEITAVAADGAGAAGGDAGSRRKAQRQGCLRRRRAAGAGRALQQRRPRHAAAHQARWPRALALRGGGAQFQRLCYTDFGGHEWRELSTDASHDVERFDRSIDGRYLAYTVNDSGSSRLMLIDQQRKLDLTVAALPAASSAH
jgi:hypothetical protein